MSAEIHIKNHLIPHHSAEYSERHSLRLKRRRDAANASALSIKPRMLLQRIGSSAEKPTDASASDRPGMTDFFPDRVLPNHSPRIGFAFAGSRPVERIKKQQRGVGPTIPRPRDAKCVNGGVVVGRRKLMRNRMDAVDERGAAYELRRLYI